MRMRLVVTAALLTGLSAVLFLSFGHFANHVQAAGGCNASSVQGPYGLTGQGFTTSGATSSPQAIVGVVELSPTVQGGPTGTLAGNATVSNRGAISRVSITGTYVVTACYVGSAVFKAGAVTHHYDFVWTQQSNSSTGIAQDVMFIQTDARTAMTLRLEHI